MLFWMMLFVAVGPADSKPMAMDDWQQMTILQVAAEDSADATQHIRVAGGDLDGDGATDEAILAFDCRDGAATNARFVVVPHDQASDAASRKIGEKQKMWVPANFRLQQVRPTYDVKTMKGNEKRVIVKGWNPEKKEEITGAATADRWTPITLGAMEGLCPAAIDAARKATKTRSNIQNN